MDIQEQLTSFAMLGASWVMWLLVGLSVIGLAIVLDRAVSLFLSRDRGDTLRSDFRRHLATGDEERARKRLEASRSHEARIVLAGLDATPHGPGAVTERLESETLIARLDMERRLAFLGTVGNNAPFVGLLGTVIGVIRAFHALESGGGQVTDGLMSEVGEALVATAIGILVALPAVAFFNYFQRVIKSRLTRAEALGGDLLAYVKAKRPEHSPKEREVQSDIAEREEGTPVLLLEAAE